MPDASFLIDLLEGRREAVDLWEAMVPEDAAVHLSPIVLFEVRFGFVWAGDRMQEATFEALAAEMPLAGFDDHDAAHAAEIQVAMMRRGQRLGPLDALIAGTCKARGLVLLTGDSGLAQVQQVGVPVRTYVGS